MTSGDISNTRRRRRVSDWFRKLITFWTLIAVVSGLALLAFADLGEDVAEHATTQLDNTVSAWFVAHQNPSLYKTALAITWIGSPTVMVLLAVAAAIWLYSRGGRSKAGTIIAAPAIGGLLSGLVKIFYGRARPVGAALFNQATYSFPSGHAATSAAVMVTLCYVFSRERIIAWPAAVFIGAVVPLLVGLSRLYLNVHWLTDVLAGWSVGLFVAAVSAALYEYLMRNAPPAVDD